MNIRSKIWLEKDGQLIFGSGKCMILKAIGRAGSINKAAKQRNMSYRRAWTNIKTIEKRLGQPLWVAEKGGRSGGGTRLTPCAKKLIKLFERLEKRVRNHTDREFRRIFKGSGLDI